jgi:hypothetical protein
MSRPFPILLAGWRGEGGGGVVARFGFDVGKQARQTLIRRLQKGDVKYARKLTTSRTVIVLDYNGREMTFLYSSAAKDIISFLGPDAPETAEWRQSQAATPALPRPPHFRRDRVCW